MRSSIVSTIEQASDKALMQQVCQGNHDAFAHLVNRHTQTFYALAYRSLQHADDAQDVVQNAFIKLWQNPQIWQADKAKFTTWFYRVIINACHDHRRKQRRLVNVDDAVFEKASSPIASEQVSLEQRQHIDWQSATLETAIANLPANQRDALNLVVYQALPQKQVAQILGVSVKAVESLLVRAKRSIIKHVDQAQAQTHNGHTNKFKSS